MGDPFRQFFLDTIFSILGSKESHEDIETLHELLKVVSPSLTLEDVIDNTDDLRNKSYKILKLRIHPDKHPNDTRVTELFQNIQNFYHDCCATLSSSASSSVLARRYSPSSSSRGGKRFKGSSFGSASNDQFPSKFHVSKKWPFMTFDMIPISSSSPLNQQFLPPYLAYTCINARGCIAHGKPISSSLFSSWDIMEQDVKEHHASHTDTHIICNIFNRYADGYKELSTVNDIKREIMENGPVISISFELTKQYLDYIRRYYNQFDDDISLGKNGNVSPNNNNNSNNSNKNKLFLDECVGSLHELLIVGWCLTPQGEMWQIHPIDYNSPTITNNTKVKPVLISTCQFNIDALCIAPKSSFESLPWQPGPYFDSDFTAAPKWREWKEMDLPLTSSEMEQFAKNCFPPNKGIVSMCKEKYKFVLRDSQKIAHSEHYYLDDMRWEDSTSEWILTVMKAS